MKRDGKGILLKLLIPAFIVLALLYCISARAGQITLTNPQEEQTENGKTLCIYENSNYTFTYLTKGKCPYAKTFDTEASN
ncbi:MULTISPECIES: hypothetical protein [Klebsiella/Raoultella group]|uniref:hypothetical protein n=1 Tax=Klebsiella/Raoultella group TaxID=2890311 RepID=UPI000BA3E2EB|nr:MULTISPECIES: hypothetical protein [Enterobacteriaceae]PJR64664.1 hypothetical protein CWM52_09905 [Raoultella sp. T31]HBM7350278.1 hypothetical protein [Klebsiella oxytoca]MCY3512457.1 hypothetical protein [Klebsiella michiganensis]MVT02320.1 hypothetical protein [Raoultella sp. 10-1]HCB2156395.1 hypothetical protein [Klebsiella oxytoca]